MCGRFALDDKVNTLIADFVEAGGDWRAWTPAYNIAPTDPIPILLESKHLDQPSVKRAELARWSLVAPWVKDLKDVRSTFNARSEGLGESRMWKTPLKRHRAIVPATGYFEWKKIPGQTRGVPHFIHQPGELIGMAGLYSWWRDPSKSDDDPDRWLLSATVLTSAAVDELVGIHDRNPVPLPRDMWDWWIDPTVTGDQAMVDAAVQAALPVASSLEVYEVAPIPFRGSGPQLLDPVTT